MIRELHVAAAILFGAGIAYAQVGLPWPGPGGKAGGGGGGYTGPGDIVSGATVWWGLRAYSSTQADGTHKAINISRASDSQTCDVFLNTSGQLGNTTACSGSANGQSTVTFCTSTTCSIVKFYDQTGNSHDAATVSSSDPTLTASATISSQAALWSGGGNASCSTTTASIPQIASVSAVYDRTGAFTSFNTVVGFGGTDPNVSQLGQNSSANTAFLFAGGSVVTATASDSAYHAVQGIFNGASSSLYIDGTSTGSLNPGAGSSTATVMCLGGNVASAGNSFNGNIREGGVWPNAAAAAFASALATMNSNQHTYWGF